MDHLDSHGDIAADPHNVAGEGELDNIIKSLQDRGFNLTFSKERPCLNI